MKLIYRNKPVNWKISGHPSTNFHFELYLNKGTRCVSCRRFHLRGSHAFLLDPEFDLKEIKRNYISLGHGVLTFDQDQSVRCKYCWGRGVGKDWNQSDIHHRVVINYL